MVFDFLQNSIYKRDSSYRSSPFAKNPEHYAKYEVTTSPEEWKFVERLLPSTTVPPPPDSKNLPSGWKPQTGMYDSKKTHLTKYLIYE